MYILRVSTTFHGDLLEIHGNLLHSRLFHYIPLQSTYIQWCLTIFHSNLLAKHGDLLHYTVFYYIPR